MKRPILVLIALATMGMGGKRPVIPSQAPAPEVYQQKFLSLGQTYSAAFTAKSVSFSFRSFFGSTVGMCLVSSNKREVEFSTSAWNGGSDTFREMLSFHELGHCLLGRDHKNSRHSDGRPDSLMNSWLFDEKTYLANRDEYLKELFTSENNLSVMMLLSAKQGFTGCGFGGTH